MRPASCLRFSSKLFVGVLILAVSALGCGGKQGVYTDSADPLEAQHAPAASGGKTVDPATAGSVAGSVLFAGTPPRARSINMAAVPNCAKTHASPATVEDFVPGDNGTLQNVVVYLKGDFSQYSFPPAKSPVKIDQNGCVYVPHVAAVMTDQPVEISNSDPAAHNVNAAAKRNQGWNQSQTPGANPIERQFSHQEVAIAVKCNVHPWMKLYLAVLDHPYFTVTGKDGSFTFKDVPPGTYQLVTWHELYGSKEQTVIVAPKETQTLSVSYSNRDR
jgi:hypothetical protein